MPGDADLHSAEHALFARLGEVYRKNGEPSSREVATRIQGMSHSTVNEAIRGRRVPSWPALAKITIALGGDIDEFRMLWVNAKDGGSSPAELPTPGARLRPEVSVFVSYASVDDRATNGRIRSITSQISDMYESLTGESVGVFLDRSSLVPGDDWRDRIRLGLASSSVFLAFISPAYLRSSMCNEEFWEFYKFLEANSAKRLLVPLIFGDVDRIGRMSDGADLWNAVQRLQKVDISELRLSSPDDGAWIQKTSSIVETIDSVLTSVKAEVRSSVTQSAEEEDDDLEPPLLEQLAKLEDAAPEFEQQGARIGDLLNGIAHQAGGATPLLVRATTTKKKIAVARQLAKSLHPYNSDLSREIDGLLRNLGIWDQTVMNALGMISRSPALAKQMVVQATLETIDATADSGISTFAEVEEARQAIGAARGLSRELDIEIRQLQRTLLRLAESKASFEKWRSIVAEYLA